MNEYECKQMNEWINELILFIQFIVSLYDDLLKLINILQYWNSKLSVQMMWKFMFCFKEVQQLWNFNGTYSCSPILFCDEVLSIPCSIFAE